MALQLTTPAFADGHAVPRKHTGDGENVSPPLAWTDPPAGTACFALICEDPDAPRGTWAHWVLLDLPPDTRALPEGGTAGVRGKNDFGRLGYGGPAPPRGSRHRYFFRLLALDRPLGLPEGATRDDALTAMVGHVLAETQLMGTYQR